MGLVTHSVSKPFNSPQVSYLVSQETKKQLLVYNFAKNGATIKGLRAQVLSEFSTRSPSIPWTSENSLFGGSRHSCGHKCDHLMVE